MAKKQKKRNTYHADGRRIGASDVGPHVAAARVTAAAATGERTRTAAANLGLEPASKTPHRRADDGEKLARRVDRARRQVALEAHQETSRRDAAQRQRQRLDEQRDARLDADARRVAAGIRRRERSVEMASRGLVRVSRPRDLIPDPPFDRHRPARRTSRRASPQTPGTARDGLASLTLKLWSGGDKPGRRGAARGFAAKLLYICDPEGLDGLPEAAIHTNMVGRDAEGQEPVPGSDAYAREMVGQADALDEFERDAARTVGGESVAQAFVHVMVALPAGLSLQQRRRVARAITRRFETAGVPYTAALHRPSADGDDRNHHLHIVASARPFIRHGTRSWSFAATKNHELFDATGIRIMREDAVDAFNRALAEAGVATRFTALTRAERGLTKKKAGSVVSSRERDGSHQSSRSETYAAEAPTPAARSKVRAAALDQTASKLETCGIRLVELAANGIAVTSGLSKRLALTAATFNGHTARSAQVLNDRLRRVWTLRDRLAPAARRQTAILENAREIFEQDIENLEKLRGRAINASRLMLEIERKWHIRRFRRLNGHRIHLHCEEPAAECLSYRLETRISDLAKLARRCADAGQRLGSASAAKAWHREAVRVEAASNQLALLSARLTAAKPELAIESERTWLSHRVSVLAREQVQMGRDVDVLAALSSVVRAGRDAADVLARRCDANGRYLASSVAAKDDARSLNSDRQRALSDTTANNNRVAMLSARVVAAKPDASLERVRERLRAAATILTSSRSMLADHDVGLGLRARLVKELTACAKLADRSVRLSERLTLFLLEVRKRQASAAVERAVAEQLSKLHDRVKASSPAPAIAAMADRVSTGRDGAARLASTVIGQSPSKRLEDTLGTLKSGTDRLVGVAFGLSENSARFQSVLTQAVRPHRERFAALAEHRQWFAQANERLGALATLVDKRALEATLTAAQKTVASPTNGATSWQAGPPATAKLKQQVARFFAAVRGKSVTAASVARAQPPADHMAAQVVLPSQTDSSRQEAIARIIAHLEQCWNLPLRHINGVVQLTDWNTSDPPTSDERLRDAYRFSDDPRVQQVLDREYRSMITGLEALEAQYGGDAMMMRNDRLEFSQDRVDDRLATAAKHARNDPDVRRIVQRLEAAARDRFAIEKVERRRSEGDRRTRAMGASANLNRTDALRTDEWEAMVERIRVERYPIKSDIDGGIARYTVQELTAKEETLLRDPDLAAERDVRLRAIYEQQQDEITTIVRWIETDGRDETRLTIADRKYKLRDAPSDIAKLIHFWSADDGVKAAIEREHNRREQARPRDADGPDQQTASLADQVAVRTAHTGAGL